MNDLIDHLDQHRVGVCVERTAQFVMVVFILSGLAVALLQLI